MHAIKTKPTLNNMHGFTLVELMVTVFLTAIAVIAIYRGYTTFSQSADAQQQTMEMQQNLRIGMTTLVKDIMRAGMKEEDSTLVAFANADAATVEFGMDLGSGGLYKNDGFDNDGDGDTDDGDPATDDLEAQEEDRIGDGDFGDDGEQIRYSLSGEDLQREVWNGAAFGAAQTVITNVSALEFVYLDEDENQLGPLPIADPAVLDTIDTVVVTLVVRTTNEDYRITNNETYQNLLLTDIYTAPGDNFRRRAMSMRVKVRNANL
jgi:prepilin-type N-terminal cleavage/methylation domain-containing protein